MTRSMDRFCHAYQARLMPLLRLKRESAKKFASTFALRSNVGLVMRDLVVTLLRIPSVAELLVGRDLSDNVYLPDYGWR